MSQEERPVRHDIIVIGASAGGVETLRGLAAQLPADLPAAVFVVQHLAPETPSVLPRILSRSGPLPAVRAEDGAEICRGTIYVAPPNCHLALVPGQVRVVAGPKENRHRPAVDVLFRTAARAYGPRVVGVVLSGSGDDGTAGLHAIKQQGGLAVVQHPADAICAAMPRSALDFVQVDHCVPLSEIGPLLARLCREPAPERKPTPTGGAEPMLDPEGPLSAPEEDPSEVGDPAIPGPRAGFSCPHCHGHLWETDEGGLLRFRCRVGHAYSAESLLAEKFDGLESTLWAAVNIFQESAALAERMASRSRDRGHDLTARRLAERAQEAERHARVLRELLSKGHLMYPGSAHDEEMLAEEAASAARRTSPDGRARGDMFASG